MDKKARSIRLDPELDEALRQLAHDQRRSINSVVVEAVQALLDKSQRGTGSSRRE